jgi:virulence-associated protein VapD
VDQHTKEIRIQWFPNSMEDIKMDSIEEVVYTV